MVSAKELVRQCDNLSRIIGSSESRIVYEQAKKFYKALEALRISVSNGDAIWCQEEVDEQKKQLSEVAIEIESLLVTEDASLRIRAKKRECLKQLITDVNSISVKDGYSVEEIAWLRYMTSDISEAISMLEMDLSGKEDVIGILESCRRKYKAKKELSTDEITI